NIVSPMIFALLYKNVMNYALPAIFQNMPQLVVPLPGENTGYTYLTILFFNVWVSFGINVLMFTGSMSGINASVIESAQLDGANTVQEFLHIYVPMTFSTVSTFIILGMTGIFTNQMSLYTFYGYDAPASLETVGYYLYKAASRADYINVEGLKGYLNYPQLAALGLILTLFVAPVTFFTRKMFDKFGPSED
ncbi:MAG: ABC transporter permease subunit, partial [Candidatus Scatosoma sp.]